MLLCSLLLATVLVLVTGTDLAAQANRLLEPVLDHPAPAVATQRKPKTARPIWTLQANGSVVAESSIVRLKDVAKPSGIPAAEWERLGAMVVALVPPDGRRLSLDRQRIAEALPRHVALPVRLHWVGPTTISVEYRLAPSGESTERSSHGNIMPTTALPAVYQANPQPAVYHQGGPPLAVNAAKPNHPVAIHQQDAEPPGVQMVVATARVLRRGDIVSASDLQLEPVPPHRSTDGLLIDMQNVVGKEVKSGLSKGRPLRADDIGSPTLVRRGDLVEVSVIGGSIIVRTSARAVQDGAAGDLIQIETQQPRRRLLARVASSGAVEIITRPPQARTE